MSSLFWVGGVLVLGGALHLPARAFLAPPEPPQALSGRVWGHWAAGNAPAGRQESPGPTRGPPCHLGRDWSLPLLPLIGWECLIFLWVAGAVLALRAADRGSYYLPARAFLARPEPPPAR